MNTTLDSKVLTCCGSINLGDKVVSEMEFISCFDKYPILKDYYFIFHDDTETLHIHYIFRFSKQTRLKTIINYLSDSLGLNPLAINIDRLSSFSAYLKYFLHIDETSVIENKKKYDLKEIYSNRSYDDINKILYSDDDNFTIETSDLISVVLDCPYQYMIMEKLGLKTYHKYRYEIKTLMEEIFTLRKIYERNE